MPAICSLVFDIGNVLIPFDFGRAMRRIAPYCTKPLEALPPEFKPISERLESGRMTGAQFVEETAALLGYSGPEAEFVAAWEDVFEENVPMTRLVAGLRERYPLYLLSNTNEFHVRYFEAKYPVFAHFSDAVYSHRAGCMKPGRKIFEMAIGQFLVNPAECVYIDDLAPNVATAAALGFHAFQYDWRRHDDLLAFLGQLGV